MFVFRAVMDDFISDGFLRRKEACRRFCNQPQWTRTTYGFKQQNSRSRAHRRTPKIYKLIRSCLASDTYASANSNSVINACMIFTQVFTTVPWTKEWRAVRRGFELTGVADWQRATIAPLQPKFGLLRSSPCWHALEHNLHQRCLRLLSTTLIAFDLLQQLRMKTRR